MSSFLFPFTSYYTLYSPYEREDFVEIHKRIRGIIVYPFSSSRFLLTPVFFL